MATPLLECRWLLVPTCVAVCGVGGAVTATRLSQRSVACGGQLAVTRRDAESTAAVHSSSASIFTTASCRPLTTNMQRTCTKIIIMFYGWFGSRVVSVLDSGAEGPGFKSQSRRCRVTVLGKLFTPVMPLFTKQQNW